MLHTKKFIQFFQSEKIGAKFYDYVKNNEVNEILILGSNFPSVIHSIKFDSFLHGSELKSYEFNLYKYKKLYLYDVKNNIFVYNYYFIVKSTIVSRGWFEWNGINIYVW